jgi:hypothetical protein
VTHPSYVTAMPRITSRVVRGSSLLRLRAMGWACDGTCQCSEMRWQLLQVRLTPDHTITRFDKMGKKHSLQACSGR